VLNGRRCRPCGYVFPPLAPEAVVSAGHFATIASELAATVNMLRVGKVLLIGVSMLLLLRVAVGMADWLAMAQLLCRHP
jgi:hypothetical protein